MNVKIDKKIQSFEHFRLCKPFLSIVKLVFIGVKQG